MEEDLISNPHDIRLNEQSQIQAILGRPPGWILRWGITFVAVCVLALLGVSWIVRYPDIIEAKVKLVTENPPLTIYAQKDGKLIELLVKDKDKVRKDKLLGVIENPADHKDVLELESLLLKTKKNQITTIPDDLKLGELQEPFSNFLQNRKDFTFFKRKKEVVKIVEALNAQIEYLKKKIISNESSKISIKEEQILAEKNLSRMTLLFADNAVSQKEVEEAETLVIQTKRKLEEIQSASLDSKMQIKDLEVQIIDLESGRAEDGNSKQLELDDNILSLQGEIEKWKRQYLIYAPIRGTIAFPKKLNQQQFVKSGENLMTILPNEGVGEIVGNALLSPSGFGKVTDTSVVYIRLDAYPYKEFGSIKTVVKNLPESPQEDGLYLVDLTIESEIVGNRIISTSNDSIPFRQELEGTARVITEDRRIIQRIFDELWSLSEK